MEGKKSFKVIWILRCVLDGCHHLSHCVEDQKPRENFHSYSNAFNMTDKRGKILIIVNVIVVIIIIIHGII